MLSGALFSGAILVIAIAIMTFSSSENSNSSKGKHTVCEGSKENEFEDRISKDVPFPSTNLHNRELIICFGEAVWRPETAIMIARAMLNDNFAKRFGEYHENATYFDESRRSEFDENYSAWVVTATEENDVWIVLFELYLPPEVYTMGADFEVTIRKADGKVISVYRW